MTSKDGRSGFVLFVSKEEKEDSTNQVEFKIGFSKAEARSLLIYFDEMVRKSFKSFGESDQEDSTDSNAYSAPQKPNKPKQEEEESENFDF